MHRDEALGQEGQGQGARQGVPGDATRTLLLLLLELVVVLLLLLAILYRFLQCIPILLLVLLSMALLGV